MVSKKILLYIGGGILALVGGYFVYKNIISQSARKSVEGMISGIGGHGMKMIGFQPENIPFIGKKEAIAAEEKMQHASTHAPTRTAAVAKAGTGRTALSLAAGHAGSKPTPVAKPVSFRPQAIGRTPTPIQPAAMKPTVTPAKKPVTSRPVAQTRARAKVPERTKTSTPARQAAPASRSEAMLRTRRGLYRR